MPNLLPNLEYFQIIFEDLGGKHEKNLKLKVSVSERKISAPIQIS